MKRMSAFLFFLLSLILWNVREGYGNTDYSFKHYNTNNGLSQNTVRSIFQDNLGFMWFGTKDGLNRFDGSNFKRFNFPSDGVLSDNVFHRILQDNNDNIWVSTEEGVYIYDIYKEQFLRFNKYTSDNDSVNGVVSEMVMDAGGGIWMSVESKGVFYYDKDVDLLTLYSFPIVEDGLKMVSLCPDNDQGVWVFPYSSPFLYINKRTGEITQFNLVDDEELLLRAGEIQDVFSDQDNLLFLGTSQKGLIAVNTINKTHKILLDVDAYGEPIFVRAIERVDQNTLWIGTESGVYIYNMLTEEVINLRHNPMMPGSLSDNAIYSVYKDRDGGIWVGSYFGGVNYYSNSRNNFELFYPIVNKQGMHGKRVREICMAPGGNLWIGTEDGGLNLFDPATGEFTPLPSPLRTLHSNVHAMLQDKEYTWISTFTKGLSRYNTLTGELVTYVHSDDPRSISHNSTFALCKDRQGVLWVGTLIGIDLYDKEKERFHRTDYLKGMSIYDIFEDSNGFIWVSTFLNGLHRFDPATKLWKVYTHDPTDAGSLPYNKPTSMFEDSKRRLWVTTQGGGIGLYNRITDTFFTYSSSNGLPNDVVYQIVEDHSGMLWLSTNHGLVRFDPERELFVNYTVENGLKTNQFNYKSSYKDSKGNIYFGSLDGFTRFNPANFYISRFKSDPVFTDLFINNQRISPRDSGSPLSQSIMFTEILKLPHDKNSISLQYATLDYAGLTNRKIYHTLEGFDNEWIMSDDNQAIVYSNLNPGSYELKLGIMIEDNDNSIEPIKRLSIVITPPFWLTGWAFMLYSLLLIAGIFLLLRFFKTHNRLKQQNSMRDFEQQKERELYRSKINFFTNVAHEIRAPLTLIKAPLDHILTKNELPEKIEDNLQIMSKNTDRLLDLTNQLLDFRKTESDSYLLNLKTHNVTELIKESQLRFTPLAKHKGIEFEFYLPDTKMFMQIDKDAFLKILSNLLNNGIKYCESYVRVNACIHDDVQQFHLFIENDGELIPQEYEDEIFKPFVQFDADEVRSGFGTGIGLALTSSLVQLHNGSLKLENDSLVNRFHLILPIGDIRQERMEIEKINFDELNVSNNGEEINRRTTVLLVDDDIELLQFEQKFLSEYYHVLIAENGVEALKVLKTSTVHLIVSDVMMPKMDGLEFLEKVKTDIEFSHIPVILLTAKVTNQSKVEGYELGADAYLDKPFSVDVLLVRIENLLRGREKLRESFLNNPFIGAATVALTKSDEEFIKKLNALVRDNLAESDFNVENMAEHFNMSRASFYRKVKGVLYLTPSEYIKVERLKKAALLLKKSDMKVNEVMYMVGFKSSSYFAKCFQQQFGVLPKDFQEQAGP